MACLRTACFIGDKFVILTDTDFLPNESVARWLPEP